MPGHLQLLELFLTSSIGIVGKAGQLKDHLEELGHTQIQTTMSYIKDAKDYYKQAPFDWINRTLKASCEDSEKNSRARIFRCFAQNPFYKSIRA